MEIVKRKEKRTIDTTIKQEVEVNVTYYIAKDGTEFKTQEGARVHEANMGLRECPRCGEAARVYLSNSHTYGEDYTAECMSCAINNDEWDTPEGAAQDWNWRPLEEAKEVNNDN